MATAIAKGGSQFESRLNFRRMSKGESSRKLVNVRSNSPPVKRDAIYKMEEGEQKNTVVVPQDLDDNPGEKIIIISKE